jgi:hypothetical protein
VVAPESGGSAGVSGLVDQIFSNAAQGHRRRQLGSAVGTGPAQLDRLTLRQLQRCSFFHQRITLCHTNIRGNQGVLGDCVPEVGGASAHDLVE